MIQRHVRLCTIVVCVVMLVACSPGDDTRDVITSTPPLPTVAPTGGPTPLPTAVPFPTVEPFTGPYGDAVGLLDGVCFEFLLGLNGQSWVWTTAADLGAFYGAVDDSKRCPGPATRGTFDFNGVVVAGIINTATGCDSAHHFVDLVQDDSARTQTVMLQFVVEPGCPYELIQPFVIVLPAPPVGYTVQVEITG